MTRRHRCLNWLASLWWVVIAAIAVTPPNGYSQDLAPPLVAAQEALVKVEDLIGSGRLDAGWAEDFSGLDVSLRNVKGFAEYVVRITRSKGEPSSISLYFTRNGVFSGSSLDQY
ncbi:MAG: hypothetical protein ACOWWM_13345 [Desulfobacterales bacterium]